MAGASSDPRSSVVLFETVFTVFCGTQVQEAKARTVAWPPDCQPLLSDRSLQRVKKKSTILLYLGMLMRFLRALTGWGSRAERVGSTGELVALAARFVVDLANSHVRVFHSVYGYFFPELSKARLTAELKGAENMHEATHTTPCSERLRNGLAFYTKQRMGVRAAAGVLVMGACLLRTAEAVRIRVKDIIWRSALVAVTTIRLGTTKSGREEFVEVPPNSLAERALKYVTRLLGLNDLVFDFTYQSLYKCIKSFVAYFNLMLLLTPHSLRAGEATRRRLRGDTVASIQDAGRWEHPKTCKTYIDVVQSLLPEVLQREQHVPLLGTSDFSGMISLPW